MQIKVNPDEELVAEIRKAIQENDGHCPCSIVKSDDTLCMCKAFRDKEEPGECHCGLYIKY